MPSNKVPFYTTFYIVSSAVTHAMFVVESANSDDYAIPAIRATSC